MRTLTLILPAHNEADSIKATLAEIDQHVPPEIDLTIYVSEDGSKDKTREFVLESAREARNSKIQLAPPADRLGYSKAVIRGIQNCKTDLIGFMDADGQCDPRDLASLVAATTPGVITIGYRNPRNDSVARRIYSKAFGIAYRLFGGPKRIDPSSPYIVATTADIKYIGETTPRLSFGFWWEFQTRIAHQNLDTVELPVNHRVRSAGETQVYALKKLPNIVKTHLVGLYLLRRDLKVNN